MITDAMIEQMALWLLRYSTRDVLTSFEGRPADHNTYRGEAKRALMAALGGQTVPLYGVTMRNQWKPGERVSHVTHPDGPYGAVHNRLGVVVSVDDCLRRHERLKVRFDDGEERYINSDVICHWKERP